MLGHRIPCHGAALGQRLLGPYREAVPVIMSHVCPLMSREVRALAEASPSAGADMGSLVHVGSLVPSEVGAVAKAYPALIADVRFLPSVGSLVRHGD